MATKLLSISDHNAMQEAATDWGPEDDPFRSDFNQGWQDQRAGAYNPPNDEFERPAYQSGYIAARETPLL